MKLIKKVFGSIFSALFAIVSYILSLFCFFSIGTFLFISPARVRNSDIRLNQVHNEIGNSVIGKGKEAKDAMSDLLKIPQEKFHGLVKKGKDNWGSVVKKGKNKSKEKIDFVWVKGKNAYDFTLSTPFVVKNALFNSSKKIGGSFKTKIDSFIGEERVNGFGRFAWYFLSFSFLKKKKTRIGGENDSDVIEASIEDEDDLGLDMKKEQ